MTDFKLSADPTINAQRANLQFQKEKTALKYYLIGKGYEKALKALGFAERYHVKMVLHRLFTIKLLFHFR
jgi:hypothetical protein